MLVVKEDILRAIHLRIEDRLEKAYPANKNPESLQRHLGPAYETRGVRGGLSSRTMLPIGPVVPGATDSGLVKQLHMRDARKTRMKAEG